MSRRATDAAPGAVEDGASDILRGIPDDLIDYKIVAKRLGITPLKLREMAKRGDFTPKLHKLTAQQVRVSATAAVDWFASRDLIKMEHKSTLRAEWVDAEAAKLRRRTG